MAAATAGGTGARPWEATLIIAAEMPLFDKKTAPIYGLVGLLHFTVTSDNENFDDDLLGYARERRKQLEAEINTQVLATLGSQFAVQSIDLHEGSIEIFVALTAVGTFFMGFSRYESFIKSVNLLISQVSGLLQKFFGQLPGTATMAPVSVTGSWQPGSTVTSANQELRDSSGIETYHIVLGYLLLSHAALLSVLLWLVIRHLK